MNRASRTRWATASIVAAFIVGIAAAGFFDLKPDAEADERATSVDGAAPTADDSSSRPADHGEAEVAVPAPSQVDARPPTSLELPSGTSVRIDASATARDGELLIPTDVDRAGWWDGSSRIGDPFGGIVVAAHVDSFDQGLGRFAELLSVRRGDAITLQGGDLAQRFRVVSAELVPKSSVRSGAEVFSITGAPRLVLITCGGAYDRSNGGYQDNLVVIAEPDGALAASGR